MLPNVLLQIALLWLRLTEGRMKDRFRIKEQLKVRRNIPAHIAFWTFALLLLYVFWKAFSGGSGQ